MTEPSGAPNGGDSGQNARRGPRFVSRRVAQAVYYGFVVFVTAAAVWQITLQVYFPSEPGDPAPFETCEEGLGVLYRSIAQARAAAAEVPPRGDPDEEAALTRYRASLAPLWRFRDRLASLCPSPERQGLLDAIERLRYSEEHAVRHQAHELSALERRVSEMVAAQLGPQPTRGAAPPSP